ncbi:cupredoxin domain-containing protein [Hyphomicrobium sp.]|uniref:cupredoxin domain-containing protein n=1 Tax=Hyphomicrobium sp. TaxID=82 RepID=UPI0025B9FFD7|nr:cupredoxin domain-containing protein [Hyphomicrobium sp.]
MTLPLPRFALALLALGALVFGSTGDAFAAKRHFVVTAVEPKGGANVEKEKFPDPLPEGGGYVLKKPDDTGRWEVAVYVFDPRQIFVDEGDEVTLEFVGINGASHPITIEAYGQTFELKRGHVNKVTFVADKPGRHSIICSAHLPTMISELIVNPKK